MYWVTPEALWLFVPYILSIILIQKKKGSFRISSLSGLNIKKTLRSRLAKLPQEMQIAALMLIIVALARPQTMDTHINRSAEGIDIVIVLDTSDSMLIEDMDPGNRIAAAKRVIKSFINELVYDRVGLVVFAGESYTKAPLTLDYGVVLQGLAEVRVSHYDPHIKKGTAIGVALANAVVRLKQSSAKSKVIIFLTDGENNVGVITPQTALDIVKRHQIKTYTIGVGGRPGAARIPREVKDAAGRKRTIYQPIQTKINETLLKQIASETKGKYFRANNSNALKVIFSEISQLEKSKIELSEWKKYKDFFPHLLKFATFFYLISLLLSLSFFWRVV